MSSMSSVTPAAKSPPLRRVGIALNVVMQTLIGFLLFVLVNYLSYRHFWRWDISRNQSFTLSEQSKNFAQSLKGRTHIVVVAARGSDEQREWRNLLNEYKLAAKSHLAIEYIDLNRDLSRRRELEQKFGLAINQNGVLVGREVSRKKNDKKDEDDNKEERVIVRKRFIPESEVFYFEQRPGQPRRLQSFAGENVITSALIGVNESKPSRVYILTKNLGNLPTAMGSDGQPITAITVLSEIAAKQNIELKTLNFDIAPEVPADAKAVISLRAGASFTSAEVTALKEYWERGAAGLCFWLDPQSEQKNLVSFLSENGVTPRYDHVLRTVQTAQGLRRDFQVPCIVVPGHSASQSLSQMVLKLNDLTTSLAIETDPGRLQIKGVNVHPLLAASEEFWGETNLLDPSPRRDANEVGMPEPIVTAAAISRGDDRDGRLGARASRMVVVGNAAMIDLNRETAQVDPLGYDFFSSVLNWVLNRENLAGITAKRIGTYQINIGAGGSQSVLVVILLGLPLVVASLAAAVWAARRS